MLHFLSIGIEVTPTGWDLDVHVHPALSVMLLPVVALTTVLLAGLFG